MVLFGVGTTGAGGALNTVNVGSEGTVGPIPSVGVTSSGTLDTVRVAGAMAWIECGPAVRVAGSSIIAFQESLNGTATSCPSTQIRKIAVERAVEEHRAASALCRRQHGVQNLVAHRARGRGRELVTCSNAQAAHAGNTIAGSALRACHAGLPVPRENTIPGAVARLGRAAGPSAGSIGERAVLDRRTAARGTALQMTIGWSLQGAKD